MRVTEEAPRILALQGADRAHVRGVLLAAAERWRRQGREVIGAVEVLPDPSDPERVHLLDLSSGETFPLNQDLGPGSAGCSLDAQGLAAACGRVEAAIAAQHAGAGAVVILSKFGRQEAEGRGLTDAFRAAVAADLPILTSVSPVVSAAWAAFAGPLARYGAVSDAAADAWLSSFHPPA